MQKIHDNIKWQNFEDRTNIIDLLLFLRLPTCSIQPFFKILVFCSPQIVSALILILWFKVLPWNTVHLEFWDSRLLEFWDQVKCLSVFSCLSLAPSVFLLLPFESPNSSNLSLLCLDRQTRPRSWCLSVISLASVCEPSWLALKHYYYILGLFHMAVPFTPPPVITWNLPACDPTYLGQRGPCRAPVPAVFFLF